MQVIAVTSGKGGVGKTSLSFNTAVALAQQGRSVLLLDADFGLANLDVMLGVRVKQNLSHVIAGQAELKEIIYEGVHGIKLIPAASGRLDMAQLSIQQQASIIHAVNDLEIDFDTLIIDTAAGLSSSMFNLTSASQHVVIVMTDEPTSLTDAYALVKLLHRHYQVSHFKVVMNMAKDLASGMDTFMKLRKVSDTFLDVTLDLIATVPFDEHVRQSIRRQKSVIDLYPSASSAYAYHHLARQFESWPLAQKTEGHLQFLFEKILQQKHHLNEGLYCE